MSQTVHATCVAWDGRAALITGQSGQGKSALALQLMAMGCVLVADDRTRLHKAGDTVVASAPDTIAGLIEARGVGILTAEYLPQASVQLVVDLDYAQGERLPLRQTITLLGCDLPLIWRVESAHFASAILQLLKSGWSDR